MMWMKCESVPYTKEKERKQSLILTPESQKFWVLDLGFLKYSRDKESSVASRAGQLATN